MRVIDNYTTADQDCCVRLGEFKVHVTAEPKGRSVKMSKKNEMGALLQDTINKLRTALRSIGCILDTANDNLDVLLARREERGKRLPLGKYLQKREKREGVVWRAEKPTAKSKGKKK